MPTHFSDNAERTVMRNGIASRPSALPDETRDVAPGLASPESTCDLPAPGPWSIGSPSVFVGAASGGSSEHGSSGGTSGGQRTSARVVDPVATPPPVGSLLPIVPGYMIKGEIARGGMGVVLAARDVVLNREVAIKTLLPGTAGSVIAIRRFVDEARITARLPHPGIPPIHALGTLPDGRPYLAMKLIKGRTLAAILTARVNRPATKSEAELDLTAPHAPGLLQVFEQICQAVAFAHSQNVIHRDLKPANIMVGAFGEVQVMDWGLARIMGRRAAGGTDNTTPRPGELDPRAAGADTGNVLSDDTEMSRAGQALGTPAYMPPEQARGEWDQVNTRADVFALGGILCVILTGQPPYPGSNILDVVRRAAIGDLRETFDRLHHCEADPELIELCKWCLQPNPADRPFDAACVAGLIEGYRLKIEEKLRTAETARMASLATAEHIRLHAEEETKARRAAEERAVRAARRAEREEQKAQVARSRNSRQLVIGFAAIVLLPLLYGELRAYLSRRDAPSQGSLTQPMPQKK